MKEQIIYQITVTDIQTVARENYGRELTSEEIKKLCDSIGEKISWYDIIHDAINDELKIEELE